MNEKTLDGFKHYASIIRDADAAAYLSKGDIISHGLFEHLKHTMPLITDSRYCLQLGEPLDYAYTPGLHLKPLYMTFTKFKGAWRYHGLCFKNETIDKSWR